MKYKFMSKAAATAELFTRTAYPQRQLKLSRVAITSDAPAMCRGSRNLIVDTTLPYSCIALYTPRPTTPAYV